MPCKPEDRIIEISHTADVSIHVAAATLEQLFINCAVGMYALSGIETGSPGQSSHKINIKGIDNESLLVAFLSDLLYRLEEDHISGRDFLIQLHPGSLTCSFIETPVTRLRKSIKAVTFHNLKILPCSEGFETTLVFDV